MHASATSPTLNRQECDIEPLHGGTRDTTAESFSTTRPTNLQRTNTRDAAQSDGDGDDLRGAEVDIVHK